jgi:glycine betaine/proline transport system permease protein
MTAIAPPIRRVTPRVRVERRTAIAVGAGLAALTFVVLRGQFTLPHDDGAPLFATLNGVRDWVSQNQATNPFFIIVIHPIRDIIGAMVGALQDALHGLTWPSVVVIAAMIGAIGGGWRLAVLGATGFLSLGTLGLWSESLDTIALIIAAVIVSLAIGIPLGILTARSPRFRAVVTPILDAMQIMPTFAYLAPLILLFAIGPAAATVATLIYAMPAAIRITALGIRSVPATTIEAATSIGATRAQMLRKVQLPLAGRAIGLAVNQTIMLALSMVVITALISAPGLGANIIRALIALDVGGGLQAGIAIVIVAILLDRLTAPAADVLDPRGRHIALAGLTGRRLVGAAVVISAVAVVGGSYLADPNTFPDAVRVSIRQPVNDIAHWITANLYPITQAIKDGVSALLITPLQTVLVESPWWLIVAVAAGIAWVLSGTRQAVIAALCLGCVALLQLWEHTMETLATVLVATAITVAVGLAVGILAARRPRIGRILRPILDAAQTLPAFVYLVPAIALFSGSRFTGIVAAVVFAAPPVIRLVEAGILTVPPTPVEAALSQGATSWQVLRKVEVPMARRAILLAINQGIIQVLAMVVVAGLVGAGGLGFDVVSGYSQAYNFGIGLAAATALVLLGIMLDRVTQGAGRIGRSAVGGAVPDTG